MCDKESRRLYREDADSTKTEPRTVVNVLMLYKFYPIGSSYVYQRHDGRVVYGGRFKLIGCLALHFSVRSDLYYRNVRGFEPHSCHFALFCCIDAFKVILLLFFW